MPAKRCVKCDSDKLRYTDPEGNELVAPFDAEPAPDDIYFHCIDCGHEWNEGAKAEEEEAE